MALYKNISERNVTLNVHGVPRIVIPNGFINLPDDMRKLHSRNSDLQIISNIQIARQILPKQQKSVSAMESPLVFSKTSESNRKHYFYNPDPAKLMAAKGKFASDGMTVKYDKVKHQYSDLYKFIDTNFNERVSICILTKDNYDIIKRCIESIEEHIKYSNLEVLIADTGSTDKRVFELYDGLDTTKYKVFKDQEYNFSKNNNFLVRQSTGDFVLLMNNDVFVTYDSIEIMVKLLHFYPIGSVGSRLIFDNSQQIIQHDGQIIHDEVKWIGPGHVNLNRKVREVPGLDGYVNGNTAAFAMYRKDLYWQVGGLDENYQDIFQDVDMNLQMSSRGFKHYCLREKYHIHVDHGTRNEGPNMGEERIKEIQSDVSRIRKNWLATKKPPVFNESTFSFVVCATKPEEVKGLCNSIDTLVTHEMMLINNRNNIFTNASEALNYGIKLSSSMYNILCHQDVRYSSNTLEVILSRIDDVEKQEKNWGVLGIAGAGWTDTKQRTFLHFMDSVGKSSGFYKEIQTLDECFSVIKNNKILHYDETILDHWHFYGADICLSAIEKGFRNYVINTKVIHLSNGLDNLNKHFKEYQIQCRRLLSKWKDKFPYITTTTMQYKDNEIIYFAADNKKEKLI